MTSSLLVVFFVLSAAGVPLGFCLVKAIFGIPCPGCGITTSIEALLSGKMAFAMRANAAGPFVLTYGVLHGGLWIASARGFLPREMILRLIKRSDQCLLVVLLASWLMRI